MIAFAISLIARIIIVCAMAYAIIVLLEHGPAGFINGLATEWQPLAAFFSGLPGQLTAK